MKRTKEAKQFRQGDVFIERISAIPEDAESIPRGPDARGIILALGEATNHAHAIALPEAAFLAKGAERFLRVPKKAYLDHEEHSRIELPRGLYRVTRQVEYSPEEIRNVQD